MSKYTQHYNLFEYDTETDKKLNFKIKDALNDNFDKLDTALYSTDTALQNTNTKIGDLNSLETTTKDSVVDAVNETITKKINPLASSGTIALTDNSVNSIDGVTGNISLLYLENGQPLCKKE